MISPSSAKLLLNISSSISSSCTTRKRTPSTFALSAISPVSTFYYLISARVFILSSRWDWWLRFCFGAREKEENPCTRLLHLNCRTYDKISPASSSDNIPSRRCLPPHLDAMLLPRSARSPPEHIQLAKNIFADSEEQFSPRRKRKLMAMRKAPRRRRGRWESRFKLIN